MAVVEIPDEILRSNAKRYIQLLRDTNRTGMEDFLRYLITTDFFKAPASTRYHLCCEGGLCQHSLNVYDLLKLKIDSGLLEIPADSLAITTLCHDICKANFYTIENRWRKDENGKWEGYKAYGVNDELPIGHGEKSCYLLQQYITLSPMEYAMIRYHMGREAGVMGADAFGNAANRWPGVAAIHTADLEASFILETRE